MALKHDQYDIADCVDATTFKGAPRKKVGEPLAALVVIARARDAGEDHDAAR